MKTEDALAALAALSHRHRLAAFRALVDAGPAGMAVGELWRLDELAADCAADGVREFFLTVKPLHVVGGVGSPPNAIAFK